MFGRMSHSRRRGLEEPDEELMQRFVDGDHAAFERLFDRHAAAVEMFVGGLVRDPELARDLVQQTFLSMVRSRLRYRRGTAVRPWLFTIAGNAARDARRREVHAARFARQEGAAERRSAVMPDPVLRDRLLAALAQLPSAQRDIVLLHKVEGWSFAELGHAFGITEAAARLRAHRGYDSLRTQLLSAREA